MGAGRRAVADADGGGAVVAGERDRIALDLPALADELHPGGRDAAIDRDQIRIGLEHREFAAPRIRAGAIGVGPVGVRSIPDAAAAVDHAIGHRRRSIPTLDVGYRAGFGIRVRSEEHTSELQSLMSISYAFFCL